MTVERRALRVTGVVQGVGFRPYVRALASALDVHGLVGNDETGVFVEIEGSPEVLDRFIHELPHDMPPMARIDVVTQSRLHALHESGFTIVASRPGTSAAVTLIPPDSASCLACLRETADPKNRRYRYPFTACARCGPRYTIITGLPYDRPNTTMIGFPLCTECQREYEDPSDRRFHAQPTACPACGPQLRFGHALRDLAPRGTTVNSRPESEPIGDGALAAAMRVISEGGIVAVKGIGGYHLVCNAGDADAVALLRTRKGRGDKPFAVMVRDLEIAHDLVHLTDESVSILTSPQAPIVVAPTADSLQSIAVAACVAPGNGSIGVMLPYSPLHVLLFGPHPLLPGVSFDALVMTSGNLADEPLCTDPKEADERLSGVADAWLHHDRPIHVACDDSVVRVVGEHQLLPIRRSRGYAPVPITLPLAAPPTLAVGGELKTTLCLAQDDRAWLSQHIGDTENLQTLDQLALTASLVGELCRIAPEIVVSDAHPGYLSRRWAQQHAADIGARYVSVQHHHAHLASLLAERGVPPGEQVLGIVFDGTGYGTDGTIWGGELLLGNYAQVERVGHVRPMALPGGDAAVRRPARAALAHLHAAGLDWGVDLPSVAAADPVEQRVLSAMLASGTGCTTTTSMGRVFDAVASLLDVRHDVDYEGQAAIELEALAAKAAPDADDARAWAWRVSGSATVADPVVLDPSGSLAAGITAVRAGAPQASAARAFHEAVADAVLAAALKVRRHHGTNTVGLSGGVFQNILLTTGCTDRLEHHGFVVHTHRTVPPNDGGLALGQAAVVAGGGGG